jgi:glycosyltransferase involved in cell wall biosynthesis
MTEYPLVSIGVPVFNAVEQLQSCLNSILNQSYPNIEVCISDNASTDGTLELCKLYAEKDSRISLNINQRNLGIAENYNIVRRMSKGKYFIWTAADDTRENSCITELVAEMEAHKDCCVVICAIERLDENGVAINTIRFRGKYDFNNMSPFRQALTILTPSTRIRKMKHGLAFYGLFDKSILDAILENDCIFSYSFERPISTIAALSGGIRYIDKSLFAKMVHVKSFSERTNDDDPYCKKYSNSSYLINTLKLSIWILRARTVPPFRKILIPVLVFPRLFACVRNGLICLLPALVKLRLKSIVGVFSSSQDVDS